MTDLNSPVRIGILGTGRIAVDGHVQAIREAGGIVAALADIVPGRAKRHALSLDIPHAYESAAEMLGSGVIDALDVCTPPASHYKDVMSALAAGFPVYLEKPPALNQAEMRSMAEMAKLKNLTLLTGTNQVFHPAVQFIKGMIDRGEMGRIYLVECHKTIRRFYRKGWHRSKAIAGGGVVMDSSTHRMDLVLYLLSNPVVQSVAAHTFAYFSGLEEPAGGRQSYIVMDVAEQSITGVTPEATAPVDIEDSVIATFQLSGGTVLSLREMVGVNMPDETVIRIYGTQSGAVLRFAGAGAGTVSVYGQRDDGTLTDSQPVLPEPARRERSHTGAFRHFFRCIRGIEDGQAGLDRAVRLMGMVDAIYESASHCGIGFYLP